MDERFDSRVPPPMERLGGPKLGGGAFRRIPILPVVALVMFFLGLAAGSGLASKAQPVPSRGPSASTAESTSTSTSTSTVSPGPSFGPSVALTPPADVLTLGQALVAAQGAIQFVDNEVVSAKLVEDPTALDQPPARWLWEIGIAEPGMTTCWQGLTGPYPDSSAPILLRTPPASISPISTTPPLCLNQAGKIDIDATTGEILSIEWGAEPLSEPLP